MRPKRVILCVCANANDLGRRAFLLETRGYRVMAAENIEQAMGLLKALPADELAGAVDLLLIDLPMADLTAETVGHAKRLRPDLHVLITSPGSAYDNHYDADVYLPRGANSPAELIERIRILVARKRGPKKKSASVGVLLRRRTVERAQ